MNESEDLVPCKGEVIGGRYRIERQVGSGGMAVVLEATDLELGKRVAIKLLRTSRCHDRHHDQRFQREAHITTRLHGHHVACVHEVGELPSGARFIVMEYLNGCDLRALLQHGHAFVPARAVRVALAAASALASAHAGGVVHRDLKPENLFISRDDHGRLTVRLIDFGVAKLRSCRPPADSEHLTAIHNLLGTAPYMAPEQIRDAHTVDERADIWSLGVILYELLTGVMPFDGDDLMHVLRAIVYERPQPANELVPELDPSLVAVVARCLEKNPADRFASAGDLAEALLGLLASIPDEPDADPALDTQEPDLSRLPTVVPAAALRKTALAGSPCPLAAATLAA